jgi:hypothetical protein
MRPDAADPGGRGEFVGGGAAQGGTPAYDQPLLAVADATVIAVVTDVPD